MPSVLFHVQYLLGIGHLQRSLRIAEALAERGVAVTLASGGMPTALSRHPAIEFVQLPPIRALDARFELIDSAGAPVDAALREQRRAALLEICKSTGPDAVIIEGFPFARRAFRFELDPLIGAVHAARSRPLLLCSLRDIVVMRDDPQRHRQVVERVRADFDAVLVHGDPRFVPLDASFPAAAQIEDRLVYTGYVAPPPVERAATPKTGEVLVSAGGGAVGIALLHAAMAARRSGCLAGRSWRLIAGGNLPDADFAALREGPAPGLVIERFRDDFTNLLQGCGVSISQAGYNTVLESIAARARAVLVPFDDGRETEQRTRAERLQSMGAAEMVLGRELSPQTLAAAIERAASREPPKLSIDMTGAQTSAELILRMIGDRAAASLSPAALRL